DGYLDDPSPSRRNLPIVVTLTVKGSDLVVDLTGTAAQVADRPINMPFVGTVDVAVWLVLRSVLLDTETYGNIPQNSGLSRSISKSSKGVTAGAMVVTVWTPWTPSTPIRVIIRLRISSPMSHCGWSATNCGRTPALPASGEVASPRLRRFTT